MTTAAAATPLTEGQLRAQVSLVRDKCPDDRVIGLHTTADWSGPSEFTVGDDTVTIASCPSPLAVREALVAHESGDGLLVVLTPCEDQDLGLDIKARMAKGRLLPIDSWKVLLELFKARTLDPRVRRARWMADALIETAPPEGYPAVPSGTLDRDPLLSTLLASRVGLDAERPDLDAILAWTRNDNSLHQWAQTTPEVRDGIREWITDTAGSTAATVLHVVESGHGADAVPLGLVANVLYADNTNDNGDIVAARVRFETLLGNTILDPDDGRRWGDAAVRLVRQIQSELGPVHAEATLKRAEELLDDHFKVPDQAWRSDVLPAGFQQRLESLSKTLSAALSNPHDLGPTEAAAQHAMAHDRAKQRLGQQRGMRMALRLARRLQTERPEPSSLHDAARRYAEDSGYADLSRSTLHEKETNPALSKVYGDLVQETTHHRETENATFAKLLAAWAEVPNEKDGVLPIENVIDRVVAPLAKQTPVLVLVLDGMSYPVFRELELDLLRQGWIEQGPGEPAVHQCAIAALPTLTNVSRASLLSGCITKGDSNKEKKAFAAHDALKAESTVKLPPVLFHKCDLRDENQVGLNSAVREAIDQKNRRVVGVVINTVDDNLTKGDQLIADWKTAAIRYLDEILEASRASGRAIIVTADHGHIHDRGTKPRNLPTENARARPDDGTLHDDEIRLTGPRVVAPDNKVIALWCESIRYTGSKQHGYHGGASPQEVVVPVAVFTPGPASLPGWSEVSSAPPSWWDAETEPPVVIPPKPKPIPGELFPPPESEMGTDDAWIANLFATPTWAEQKKLAGRLCPPDEKIRTFFAALDSRGGKMTRAALSHTLGLPLIRLNGVTTALRRIVNVDGYEVIDVDEESDSIALNRTLLDQQFGL